MAAPVLQFKRGLLANLPGLRAGEPGFTTDSYDLYVGIDSTSNNNKFFGSHRYWSKETTSTGSGINLVEGTGTGTQYITLKAPDSLAGIVTFTLPAVDGIANQVLKTDGNGVLGFATISSNLSIAGDTGTDTVLVGADTLTFEGTASEIETTITNNKVKIGLPDNVIVGGGLTVSGIGSFQQTLYVGGIQVTGSQTVLGDDISTRHLYVAGVSTFVGAVTFQGGTIGIGDSDTDNISVAGEFVSNLVPNATNTYDLGLTGKRWRDGFYSGNVDIAGNLFVDGNVTVGGGNTVILYGQDVYIKNKDIILGYTTSITNTDASTDTTANHAGVAIASTEGSPLTSFAASGINTLPDTYKQLMWFKQGTLGFGTDAFAFNYGVAIGTTTMADGDRFAVGSGIRMTDTAITATTFNGALSGNASSADQVKTVTASDTAANYYVTFVDSHNGSATNETVYTDDGIYYNPGTNTFTTQHALFTGNVEVQGTLTGTATTATRATTVDTTATSTNATYYVPFVDTLAGENGETIRVGAGLSLNPSDGSVATGGVLSVGNAANLTSYIKSGGGSNAMYLYANGDVSFQAKVITNSIRSSSDSNNAISLSGRDVTLEDNVKIVGVTTIGTGVGVTQFTGTVATASSTTSVPTNSAIIDYVGTQISNVDLTTGLAADTGGPSTFNTSQTLTISGTAGEIETSVSSQTVTVGLPDTVIVGTALSTPTLRTATIQHQNGTQAATIDSSGNITAAQNLSVTGNLYVAGSTTQVNTDTLTVEDRTIELGIVNGSAPGSPTTWDLGVLFNYYSGSAKKSAVVWEHADGRFKFGSEVTDGGGTDQNSPQITVGTYAPIEVSELWINNTCVGGSTQVIACSGATLVLQNITIDGGSF